MSKITVTYHVPGENSVKTLRGDRVFTEPNWVTVHEDIEEQNSITVIKIPRERIVTVEEDNR